MWKKALSRGTVSYCVCVAASNVVTLIMGLCGAQAACVPEFVERVGSPVTAAGLQPLLIGLIGFVFGAGSLLFEVERWSFLRQGALHLALTAAVWIPVELICFSPITPPAVLSFALSAGGTYAITWGVQYMVWKKRVRELNALLQSRKEERP